jgi:uncharacterized protein
MSADENMNNSLFRFKSIPIKDRIVSIDTVRGFALLGILVVNTLFFAFPLNIALQPPFEEQIGSHNQFTDWISWWFVNLFFQYKFMTLFSILFGVGAAIQYQRAQLSGTNFDAFFIRRMVVLLGFGILHAVLFWYGDILTIYACCGVWLLLFCRLSNKTLILLTIGLLLFTAILSGGFTLVDQMVTPPGREATGLTGFEAIWSSGLDPKSDIWMQAELVAYQQGPYLDLFVFRAISWLMYLIVLMVSNGWHVTAMFALGVVLYRTGFFSDEGVRIRRLAMYVGLPIGLLVEGICFYAMMLYFKEEPIHLTWIMMAHELSVPLVSLGYAAIMITLTRRSVLPKVLYAFSCVGRMALTNYLLETFIMTSLFYYYGLGLFGEVGRIYLIPIALGTWIALSLFSVAWLGSYKQGPLEWLWRRLAYGSSSQRG